MGEFDDNAVVVTELMNSGSSVFYIVGSCFTKLNALAMILLYSFALYTVVYCNVLCQIYDSDIINVCIFC